MASASRKTFRLGGTRRPKTASAATAKAMSVAIGTPQPEIAGPPACRPA